MFQPFYKRLGLQIILTGLEMGHGLQTLQCSAASSGNDLQKATLLSIFGIFQAISEQILEKCLILRL